MPDFYDILENLQETEAAIARLENTIVDHPGESSLLMTLESLYARQRNLQHDFSSVADENFLDVCTYRLISKEKHSPSLSSIGRALCDFQSLFSIVYDALKNGPKARASFSAEIAKESGFNFGYSFSGSIGFVLTMPNERLLLIDSELDESMNLIFDLAKAESSEIVRSYAKKVGPAPIRKIYEWASNHIDASMDADIKWKRNEQIRSELFLQKPEWARLTQIIEATSEEEPIQIEVTGRLIGGDIKARQFHMAFEGEAEDIKGRLGESVSINNKELNQVYTAVLEKITKTYYSIEKEDISYVLLDLKNP